MGLQFKLAENVRHRFCGPVQIRCVDPDGTSFPVSGDTVDVSVYGLGLTVPIHIPVDTEVTVVLCGVELCGSAKVRHSQPCSSGFRMGLHFGQALVMQKIPGIDEVLIDSFYSARNAGKPAGASLLQRMRVWFWRAIRSPSARQ